jgi:hypothetical protein
MMEDHHTETSIQPFIGMELKKQPQSNITISYY